MFRSAERTEKINRFDPKQLNSISIYLFSNTVRNGKMGKKYILNGHFLKSYYFIEVSHSQKWQHLFITSLITFCDERVIRQ